MMNTVAPQTLLPEPTARSSVAQHPRQNGPLVLMVTIDTEEEFDWSRPPAEQTPAITHTSEIPRLQDALEDAGARPTYVIDYPLLRNEATVRVLGELAARGTCELGAHLHPWVNPPVVEAPLARHTYLCNLPYSLQVAKVASLTEAFRDAFGRSPVSFKAGRYGMDFRLALDLQNLGYQVDGSVVAYTSFNDDEGPDFRPLDNHPYQLVAATEHARAVWEVPCSVAYTRRHSARAHRVHTALAASRWRRLRPIGMLWHTGLLRKIFLSPEVHSCADLLRGVDALAASGDQVIQLSLHSPSIVPGHTPYVRSFAERDQLLDTLKKVVRHARERWGAVCLTLSEYVASRQEALT